jgi:hypothetical protein
MADAEEPQQQQQQSQAAAQADAGETPAAPVQASVPDAAPSPAAVAAASPAAAAASPLPLARFAPHQTHIAYLHAWPLIGRLPPEQPFAIKKLDFESVRDTCRTRGRAEHDGQKRARCTIAHP